MTVNKVSSSERRKEIGETWRSVEICGKSLPRDKGHYMICWRSKFHIANSLRRNFYENMMGKWSIEVAMRDI